MSGKNYRSCIIAVQGRNRVVVVLLSLSSRYRVKISISSVTAKVTRRLHYSSRFHRRRHFGSVPENRLGNNILRQ